MSRELLAQIFSVLMFLICVFPVVVAVRFFSQLARGEAPRVSEAQGLLWLACSCFFFLAGAGTLVIVVLDRVLVLLPLGLVIVVVGLFLAARAMQLLRGR